jgi:hypothetical protein
MVEHQQHQRQRLLMVFGKQNSVESVDKSNTLTSRLIPMPINDKKVDETSSITEATSTTISKFLPMQPDNIPMNLISRFDSTISNQLTTINRMQSTVRL